MTASSNSPMQKKCIGHGGRGQVGLEEQRTRARSQSKACPLDPRQRPESVSMLPLGHTKLVAAMDSRQLDSTSLEATSALKAAVNSQDSYAAAIATVCPPLGLPFILLCAFFSFPCHPSSPQPLTSVYLPGCCGSQHPGFGSSRRGSSGGGCFVFCP